jgi:hypothetical protein
MYFCNEDDVVFEKGWYDKILIVKKEQEEEF